MNEFKIKNGYLSEGNSQITGSLNVSGGITGSLFGTASYATTTISASYAITASYVTGSIFTNSNSAASASFAQTASYATYAANGGVTKILAGANVNLSPVSGLGDVTVTSFGTNLYNTATGSYGSFYDTGSVLATSATTIYSMSLSTTDISNGVFVSSSNGDRTRVKFTNAGTYNIQFSSQFSNTDNSTQDAVVWIRKNGTDVTDSSGVVGVPPFKAGSNGQAIGGWNYYLNLSAGDYIQMCWHVEQANVITLETIAAGVGPTYPRTPSTILTATRVDTFLSNTGSFSGSFTGTLTGTASYATNALSASYAPSTPPFPFTGSALITGSLGITGSLNNGSGNIASGNYSHAEGDTTTATGSYSHAEGNSTTSIGNFSHAEGSNTNSLGSYSHAEGDTTTSTGEFSHAEGESTNSYGTYSHAEGRNTTAGQLGYTPLDEIISGVFELDPGYQDLTSLFTPGVFILIDDVLGEINGTPNIFKLEVASSTYNGTPATEITLVDTSINISTNKYTVGIYSVYNPTLADASIGSNSHTSGDSTHTIGIGSSTEGFYTEALGYYQSVVGIYNEPINDFGAFIIGGGYDNTPRNLLVASPLNQIVTITGSATTYKPLTTQENLSAAFTVSGEIIESNNFDGAVILYDLISLVDGTWYQTVQSNINSERLLGIYIGDNKVLLSGYLTFTDSTGDGPLVGGTIKHGLVVYIQEAAVGLMNTTVPTVDYVRTLGHILYQNANNTANFTMKFNPSNDWTII